MSEQYRFISGTLEPFFETGSEGILWSVHETRVPGYDGLNVLKNGDYLIILENEANSEKVIWEGVIDLEYETNYRPYPMNPQYGQQAINGYWVNGVQRGFNPEKWFELFRQERSARLGIAQENK